ncbi:hypothetical protein OG384_04315 [Streptomyces sp. NBC_01324]|uniref:hypothetical protein n=1 Tax=Streptomyces sp. NBC_01324 TaxID=2903826 RepID=UPI002E163432|nr:hypothetical protein OG384_04315 [Streptomyces sp. NBC_01324]
MTAYQAGDRVYTATGDQDPPDGTPGTITHIHADPGDGIDITLDDGRIYNILECGLEPGAAPRERQA